MPPERRGSRRLHARNPAARSTSTRGRLHVRLATEKRSQDSLSRPPVSQKLLLSSKWRASDCARSQGVMASFTGCAASFSGDVDFSEAATEVFLPALKYQR